MKRNLTKIFSVAVFHSYYEDNRCSCIQFVPFGAMPALLDKFGFKINANANGFGFYANTANPILSLLDYIEATSGTDCFEFSLVTDNPNFTLFTDTPMNSLGQLDYSSRDTVNKQENGNIILGAAISSRQDLRGIGSLKIYFDDIRSTRNQDVPNYQIDYTARTTQWQYYLINRNAISLNNPAIKDRENVAFSGPEAVVLQTGEKAMLFSSNHTFPFSERPKYKFDLIDSTSENGLTKMQGAKTIIKGLPVPDASKIQIKGEKQFSSPMYIYL